MDFTSSRGSLPICQYGNTSFHFSPAHVLEDVLCGGSDTEETEDEIARKRQRYEAQAERVANGFRPMVQSATLQGPLSRGSGWVNPWRCTQNRRNPGWWRAGSPDMLFTKRNVMKRATNHIMGHLSPAEAFAGCKSTVQTESAWNDEPGTRDDRTHSESSSTSENDGDNLCCMKKDEMPENHAQVCFEDLTPYLTKEDNEREGMGSRDDEDGYKRARKRSLDTQWLKGSYISKRARWDESVISTPTPVPDLQSDRRRHRYEVLSQSDKIDSKISSPRGAPKRLEVHQVIGDSLSGVKSRIMQHHPELSQDRPHGDPARTFQQSLGLEAQDVAENRDSQRYSTMESATGSQPTSLGKFRMPSTDNTNHYTVRSNNDYTSPPKPPQNLRDAEDENQNSSPLDEENSFVTNVAPSSRNVEEFQFWKKRIKPDYATTTGSSATADHVLVRRLSKNSDTCIGKSQFVPASRPRPDQMCYTSNFNPDKEVSLSGHQIDLPISKCSNSSCAAQRVSNAFEIPRFSRLLTDPPLLPELVNFTSLFSQENLMQYQDPQVGAITPWQCSELPTKNSHGDVLQTPITLAGLSQTNSSQASRSPRQEAQLSAAVSRKHTKMYASNTQSYYSSSARLQPNKTPSQDPPPQVLHCVTVEKVEARQQQQETKSSLKLLSQKQTHENIPIRPGVIDQAEEDLTNTHHQNKTFLDQQSLLKQDLHGQLLNSGLVNKQLLGGEMSIRDRRSESASDLERVSLDIRKSQMNGRMHCSNAIPRNEKDDGTSDEETEDDDNPDRYPYFRLKRLASVTSNIRSQAGGPLVQHFSSDSESRSKHTVSGSVGDDDSSEGTTARDRVCGKDLLSGQHPLLPASDQPEIIELPHEVSCSCTPRILSQVLPPGEQTPWLSVDVDNVSRVVSLQHATVNDDATLSSNDNILAQAYTNVSSESVSEKEEGQNTVESLSITNEEITPFKNIMSPASPVRREKARVGLPSTDLLYDSTNNPWAANTKTPASKKRVSFGALTHEISQEKETEPASVARRPWQRYRSPPPLEVVEEPLEIFEEDSSNYGTIIVDFRNGRTANKIPGSSQLHRSPAIDAQAQAFIAADLDIVTEQDCRQPTSSSPTRHLQPRNEALDNSVWQDSTRDDAWGNLSSMSDSNTHVPKFNLEDVLGEVGGFLEDWSVEAEVAKAKGRT